jgi:hypothetical protein
MRTIMAIAFAANLLLSVCANNLETAIASQIRAVSVDPISMPENTAALATQEYPGF